jgi:hypothetical protein
MFQPCEVLGVNWMGYANHLCSLVVVVVVVVVGGGGVFVTDAVVDDVVVVLDVDVCISNLYLTCVRVRACVWRQGLGVRSQAGHRAEKPSNLALKDWEQY